MIFFQGETKERKLLEVDEMRKRVINSVEKKVIVKV